MSGSPHAPSQAPWGPHPPGRHWRGLRARRGGASGGCRCQARAAAEAGRHLRGRLAGSGRPPHHRHSTPGPPLQGRAVSTRGLVAQRPSPHAPLLVACLSRCTPGSSPTRPVVRRHDHTAGPPTNLLFYSFVGNCSGKRQARLPSACARAAPRPQWRPHQSPPPLPRPPPAAAPRRSPLQTHRRPPLGRTPHRPPAAMCGLL